MPPCIMSSSPHIDERLSPFEQISSLENAQETRVTVALEEFSTEERDTAKAIVHSQKLHEDRLREEARAELRAYADKEPAAILTKSYEQTEADLVVIAREYQAQTPKLKKALMDMVLALSFKS